MDRLGFGKYFIIDIIENYYNNLINELNKLSVFVVQFF